MIDERFIIGENGIPRPSPVVPEEPTEDESEQFAGEPFARRVVSYLLGQMSEEESERFEDECFARKNWPSQVNLAEEDLIDAYLHDELEPEQRGLFERNYLTTEARQERVRMAAALLRQVCEGEAVVARPSDTRKGETWAERLKVFFGGRGLRLRVGAAVAALVIIVGVSWWLYLSRARAPRVVATMTLTSSVINRSEGVEARTIKLSPDADALRVSLVLPDRATTGPHYRAELENDNGETVPLAVEGQDAHAVSVLIPASRLSRGQYVLTLIAAGDDGAGQPVYSAYYFFVE
jgi:anti-sigma factor RsiW